MRRARQPPFAWATWCVTTRPTPVTWWCTAASRRCFAASTTRTMTSSPRQPTRRCSTSAWPACSSCYASSPTPRACCSAGGAGAPRAAAGAAAARAAAAAAAWATSPKWRTTRIGRRRCDSMRSRAQGVARRTAPSRPSGPNRRWPRAAARSSRRARRPGAPALVWPPARRRTRHARAPRSASRRPQAVDARPRPTTRPSSRHLRCWRWRCRS